MKVHKLRRITEHSILQRYGATQDQPRTAYESRLLMIIMNESRRRDEMNEIRTTSYEIRARSSARGDNYMSIIRERVC
jgi:hypothetical protein